jgi:acylphosphatase
MVKHLESGIAGKGLGFNYLNWIRNLAIQLKIKGIVFTRRDGSIKVIAEGEETDLIEFTEKIKKGGFLSEIENFYVKWGEPSENLGNFYVVAN